MSKTIKWSSRAIKHVKIANQTSKQIESPCLKKKYLLIDQLNATSFSTSVQAWSSKSPVESPICGPIFFTCAPTRLARLSFYLWKFNFLEKSWSRHLFYFYFKGKIKQERKTLKCDSIIFGKSMSLKNPSLSLGIRLPIGKVPLKGSTPLSPIKVSTN